jgi:hypothetical protein
MNPRSEIQKGDLVEIITCRYKALAPGWSLFSLGFIVAGFTEFPQKKAYAAINGRACLYTAVDCLMKIEPMMDDGVFENNPHGPFMVEDGEFETIA